ncbi:hypothetical protein ACFFV7_10585 [Nonomuraea spiralis]|uniref:Secreted protein n=1 Tax=Nonomuraea spiralis TaxID=46182 RepID=A0ABV5IC47_9ACTN|nr:hypothetical protein [Nonomuraea spiralis]
MILTADRSRDDRVVIVQVILIVQVVQVVQDILIVPVIPVIPRQERAVIAPVARWPHDRVAARRGTAGHLRVRHGGQSSQERQPATPEGDENHRSPNFYDHSSTPTQIADNSRHLQIPLKTGISHLCDG